MFKGYFFSANGLYHVPVYLLTEDAVVQFVFRYKAIVPKIMVTDGDDISTFEAEKGEVIFPKLEPAVVSRLEHLFPAFDGQKDIESLVQTYGHDLDAYIRSRGRDEVALAKAQSTEADLLALAARQGVNLGSFGWKSSAQIISDMDL